VNSVPCGKNKIIAKFIRKGNFYLTAQNNNTPNGLINNTNTTRGLNLLTSMLEYAGRKHFFSTGDKILAAVSGGVDSMVMLRLLHDAGFNLVAAHCNFGLRGDESDLDEAFVKNEADKLNIPCRVKHFDTCAYAAQNGLSTQIAARELRYKWFHESGLDAIAIAHNRDDSIETLFINLARGTGIHGLTGIRPKSGKIIRPLLFASREEIEAYAKTHNIAFREDSSNATDAYARNYIRRNVIPGMEQFFPGMRQAIERSMALFSEVELFYNDAIELYKNKIVTLKDDLMYIDLKGLSESPSSPTLLYEILKSFGFSNTIAAEILEEQHSGRQFFSDTHRLVYDRQSLILQKLDVKPQNEYLINEDITFLEAPLQLKIDKLDKYPDFTPDSDPNIACLDGDKLQYPILLRNWKHGDKFCPLGMKNMKKLSDFFNDAKLSLIEKERIHVLVSGGKIAWIAGLRIDDRFKITDSTKKIVKFKIICTSQMSGFL